jgi:serine/threonine protein kinase
MKKKIAVKIIDLTVSGKQVVDGDVNIWGQLRHHYIINLMLLVTKTDVQFLVMPLSETDLFLQIYDNGAVSEQKSRDLIKQILSGLKYMQEMSN